MKITAPEHYRGDDVQRVTPTITVTSTTGVRFMARLIRTGDKFGLDECLTVGEGRSVATNGPGPLVEFYDTRFPHTQYGQFVSRYGVDTILGRNQWGDGVGGLDLMGYVDSWTIDAAAMDVVRYWLAFEVSREIVEPEVAR